MDKTEDERRYFEQNAREGSAALLRALMATIGVTLPEPRQEAVEKPKQEKAPPRRRVQRYVPLNTNRSAKIARVQKAVADYYRIPPRMIEVRCRAPEYSYPRHVTAYVARKLGVSFPQLGRHFGYRDHTTMIHAVRKVEGKPQMLREAEEIAERLWKLGTTAS